MLTSLNNAKRAIVAGMAMIAAVVLVPALAKYQSINVIVNANDVAIKSPLAGTLDGFYKRFNPSVDVAFMGENVLWLNPC